uniref:CENPB protein putative n=1 Tax=Albugo laibachii Nc14 TaxID=890382 RepID=F0WZ72_9STRA|nr:CENPB protein putative [Albugo laibachii Nc14]|eukprot:CCA26788.1 CENPB protein putative [Albugo laibachii Nc14]
MILDNCPAHTKLKNMPPLSNTEEFHLSPNITSKLQPFDAVINRCFKAYYRRSFYQRLLLNVENGIVNRMKVDMLESFKMFIEAWINVKAFTIRNCFQLCSIRTRLISTPIIPAEMIDDPALIQELDDQLAQFPFSDLMDIKFRLNHPSERETHILPTDDEIIQQFNGQKQENLSSYEMDDSNQTKKLFSLGTSRTT